MKKCNKCYVEIEVKEYTILRGIFVTILFQLFLLVPLLGLVLAKEFYEEGYKEAKEGKPKAFWNQCWYNRTKKKIKVKGVAG